MADVQQIEVAVRECDALARVPPLLHALAKVIAAQNLFVPEFAVPAQ
jgi:hypothetical protein